MQSSHAASSGVLATVLLASVASGQGLMDQHCQVVGATGDVIPGTGGLSIGTASGFAAPLIADDGKVLFRSRISTGSFDLVLLYGDSLASLVVVARNGAPEPSGTIPGATISNLENPYFLASDGRLFFSARVSGAGITFSDDALLYAGTPGNLQVVAREASQAAGSPAGTFYTPSGGSFGDDTSLAANASGRVAFLSPLSGALTSNQAMFTGTPGALERVMMQGEVIEPGVSVASLGRLQMNASGQVLIDLVKYLGFIPNDALWLYTPGAGKQEILREGNASPIPFVTFADTISPGSSFRDSFNSAGQVLVSTGLASTVPGVVTFDVDDRAIFIASAVGHTLVARKGAPAPGIPGKTLQLITGPTMRLNDNGVVAFNSAIADGGLTPKSGSAIWIGTPGNMTLVARAGEVCPGTGGSTFGDLEGVEMLLNNADQLLFYSIVSGGAIAGTAMMAWDPVLGLQPLVLPGDLVEVKPGNIQPCTGAGTVSAQSNGGSRSLSLADDGTLSTLNGFGPVTAEVKTRLGSLTGFPKSLSAASGGTHKLFLNAGQSHAGELYLVVGSISGTTPGFAFGGFPVPLNFDVYTNLMLTHPNTPPFTNTSGFLSAQGRATASITLPPGLGVGTGIVAHHAFATINAFGALTFVSEASKWTLLP